MKFATTIVNALAVAALLAVGAEAVGVRGGVNRELAEVNCITVTNSDGSTRTVAPCTTVAPASTGTLTTGESKDDEDDEDEDNDLDDMDGVSEDGLVVVTNPSPPAPQQQVINSGMATATIPPIVGVAMSTPSLSSLAKLVFSANLANTLNSPGPFTVFAPVNAALPSGAALDQLELDPALPMILKYHVVPGIIRSTDLVDGAVATTVQGSDVIASVSGKGVKINEANVILADVEASNGIVHLLDAVLVPPDASDAPAAAEPPITAGSDSLLTPAAPVNPPAPSAGGICSASQLAEFDCDVVNDVVGVHVCRAGRTRCVLSFQTTAGDTCGCCPGDNSPGCIDDGDSVLEAIAAPPVPPVTVNSNTPSTPSTGGPKCSAFHLTEFACGIGATNVAGVLVCRGGFSTCVEPSRTMIGDNCGCCFGDLQTPGCIRSGNNGVGPSAVENEDSLDMDRSCTDC